MNTKDISNGLSDRLSKKLHYWFVQYNPFYFFSALCVLFGMFLIARELAEMGWRQGQLSLTAVMQLYEILLISGGALLFRVAGQHRPAVILGLMEVFFLFDCTFQTEIMTTLGRLGIIAAVGWLVIVALKLKAIVWMFRLKVSATVFIFPILAALGLAGFPHVLDITNVNKILIHLVAIWYGSILVVSVKYIRFKVECAITLEEWGQTVLRRSTKAALAIWAGFYLFHLMAWIEMFSIPIKTAQVAPFFLLCFFVRDEIWAWAGGIIIIILTLTIPCSVSPTAFIVGIFYGLKARQTKRHRFYVGTVVYFYIAIWTIGWKGGALPEPNLWLTLTTILFLLVMAWRFRLLSAIPATALVMLPEAENLLPKGPLQWGIFIIVIGFTTLIAGIAINWSQRKLKSKYNQKKFIEWKEEGLI